MERLSPSTGPVTVQTSFGSASFERRSESDAEFRLDYDIPEQDVHGEDAADAIAWTCSREIAHMRRVLAGLGSALAVRLSNEGIQPKIERTWENHESRDWTKNSHGIRIANSGWESKESLSGLAGVSEKKLVLSLVAATIEQRRVNIGACYAEIFRSLKAGPIAAGHL